MYINFVHNPNGTIKEFIISSSNKEYIKIYKDNIIFIGDPIVLGRKVYDWLIFGNSNYDPWFNDHKIYSPADVGNFLIQKISNNEFLITGETSMPEEFKLFKKAFYKAAKLEAFK